MTTVNEIYEAVVSGQLAMVSEKVRQGLAEGISASTILNDGLIAAMREVGEQFEAGEAFVPEMLIAAKAMEQALIVLKPHLIDQGVKPHGRVAIGTVKGDLHDIGKKLVSMMLEGSGFEIVDLGTDVLPERFVQAVRDGAQVVALSALLTTTMPAMKAVVEALNAAGLRDQVQVIVGGAPLTQAYADQIGADGFAPDASSAVRKVHELLGTSRT
jgi:5-methyltetrahydrofolate--homocysteine methyltransferase